MKETYAYYNGYLGGKKRVGPVTWDKMQQWRHIVNLRWKGVLSKNENDNTRDAARNE